MNAPLHITLPTVDPDPAECDICHAPIAPGQVFFRAGLVTDMEPSVMGGQKASAESEFPLVLCPKHYEELMAWLFRPEPDNDQERARNAEDEQSLLEHYERTARDCRSCPECADVPCAACLAGGICDRTCRCAERGSDDDKLDTLSEEFN